MIHFRQTSVGVMLAGSSFWFAVHLDGRSPLPPQFDPPTNVGMIESYRQSGPKEYWRWSGALAGGSLLYLGRGQSLDVFTPGALGGPALHLTSWSPGDWDFNNSVNSADVSAFLSAWVVSIGSGSLHADFNVDGQVNSSDIAVFLAAWVGH